MRHQQGKYIVGYVTVQIKGRQPDQFIQSFVDLHFPIWNIKIISATTYEATIYLHHLDKMEELATTYNYMIESVKDGGILIKLKGVLARKDWILAGLFSVCFLFLIANTAWKVEITGVPTHLEDAIEKKLAQSGLYEGAWTYSLTPLELIQEQLLNEIPDLLYIGIQQKGTSFYVDAIEKKMEKPREVTTQNELIATKDGIVQKMFIKSGVPLVERNDMVKKGDILVTSNLEITEENSDQDKQTKKVPVQGKVFANTWYNIQVSANLEKSQALLTGESITQYQLQFGDMSLPLWGWSKQPYTNQIAEYHTQPLRLWKWTLPITFIQKDLYEYEANKTTLSQDEVAEKAISHIKENLKRKYGQDVEILKYYVLHETVENGKVKMNLYVSILENIAKGN